MNSEVKMNDSLLFNNLEKLGLFRNMLKEKKKLFQKLHTKIIFH